MPLDLDILRNAPRRIDHRRCIEDRRAASNRGNVPLRRQRGTEVGLQGEPLRVVLGGEGFADTGRAITQANIAIAPAGITELGKAPVFGGHDKIRRQAIH